MSEEAKKAIIVVVAVLVVVVAIYSAYHNFGPQGHAGPAYGISPTSKLSPKQMEIQHDNAGQPNAVPPPGAAKG